MEARKYEEAEGLEEEVLGIAKQYNRRSKMTTKAKKPLVKKDPTQIPASKVNKQKMVDAIVGLETQMQKLTMEFDLLSDAFRQYIQFQGNTEGFQKHLDNTTEERKAAAKKLADESNTESK